MKSINLELKTVSETGNFNGITRQIFVIHRGYVYFIDLKRLSVILSLMQLLSDFNEYINTYKTSNITDWLKHKNLFSQEILAEISFYKVKCNCSVNECLYINQFFAHGGIITDKQIFKNNMINLFKTNLKNALLFDYMMKYNDKFNKFISDIFLYFKNNPKDVHNQNLLDFADYIFTCQKKKLFEKLKMIEDLYIFCEFDNSYTDLIEIKNIKTHNSNLYFECIKKNFIVDFKIIFNDDNDFCLNTDKYLQIAEFLNNKRLIEDNIYYSVCSGNVPKCNNITSLDNSNFSFINSNLLLVLGLNDENKIMANELLGTVDYKSIYNDINTLNLCCFDYIDCQRFLNYSYIKIQD